MRHLRKVSSQTAESFSKNTCFFLLTIWESAQSFLVSPQCMEEPAPAQSLLSDNPLHASVYKWGTQKWSATFDYVYCLCFFNTNNNSVYSAWNILTLILLSVLRMALSRGWMSSVSSPSLTVTFSRLHLSCLKSSWTCNIQFWDVHTVDNWPKNSQQPKL